MIAYKGFRGDLTCTMGKGIYQYRKGETVKEERSKCVSRGLHCAENPLDCLKWYPLGSGNRYFAVEAAGSIDEDGRDTKIACTEMTLLNELSIKELTGHAMMYMVKHPARDWEASGHYLDVRKDKAAGQGTGSIAIARGKNPKVKGKTGSILGLLREESGFIEEAKLFEVAGDIKPDTWYRIEGREPKEETEDEA